MRKDDIRDQDSLEGGDGDSFDGLLNHKTIRPRGLLHPNQFRPGCTCKGFNERQVKFIDFCARCGFAADQFDSGRPQ